MSVSENFEDGYDAGLTRSWDPKSARRQFQMSLVLVAALICSAVVLATTLRFDPPMTEGRSGVVKSSVDRSAVITAPFAGSLAPMVK
jgi:hypothetical protein